MVPGLAQEVILFGVDVDKEPFVNEKGKAEVNQTSAVEWSRSTHFSNWCELMEECDETESGILFYDSTAQETCRDKTHCWKDASRHHHWCNDAVHQRQDKDDIDICDLKIQSAATPVV